MIEKLRKHHQGLRELYDELLILLSGDLPCDWHKLAQVRWNLVRTHVQASAAEDRLAFILHRDTQPQLALAASRLARQREANHVRVEDHMIHWTRALIERNWSDFATDARQLATCSSAYLDRAERLFDSLLDRNVQLARLPGNRDRAAANWMHHVGFERLSA
jgi:hypothetical protein